MDNILQISSVYKRTTTITGLAPYNMYTFTVRELSKGIWGPFSEAVDQIMPEDSKFMLRWDFQKHVEGHETC